MVNIDLMKLKKKKKVNVAYLISHQHHLLLGRAVAINVMAAMLSGVLWWYVFTTSITALYESELLIRPLT